MVLHLDLGECGTFLLASPSPVHQIHHCTLLVTYLLMMLDQVDFVLCPLPNQRFLVIESLKLPFVLTYVEFAGPKIRFLHIFGHNGPYQATGRQLA